MEASYNIVIKLKFTAIKKLLVRSTGLAPKTKADLMFARVVNGDRRLLIIPSSTIKGVLRTSMIRVSKLLGYMDVEPSVHPKKIARKDDIVTRIFGKPHNTLGKIIVSNAILEIPEGETLTHVRLDDSTRTAKERALFSAEYLPIKLSFKAELKGHNLTIEEVEALMAAIAEMRYERFGRAGLLDVKILLGESAIPKELVERSTLVREVLEVIGQ